VFISYSHDFDARLGESLQSSLGRFAKPWYRLRSMRVFRDKSGLAANPALWDSIQQALTDSEYLLLLASPASAKSPWVQKEVQWWLQNRSVDNLLIALTDGVILWDNQAGDFDWSKTVALSEVLKGAFPAEPLYADFRPARADGKYVDSSPAYRDALLDIVAPLTGRPKEDLDSEDIRLHRKAQRTAWAAAAFIVVLGLAAAVAMNVAYQRQQTATSRALASEATSKIDDRSLALLLSLESGRVADTVESKRSLLAALQRISHADRFLWGHTNAVTKAVFSPDGRFVLSAGWDNRIILWSAATGRPLGEPIAAPQNLVTVAFNPDGSRFVSSGKSVVVWDTLSHQPVGEPFAYQGEEFVQVAFSSSGKMLAASTDAYGAHPARVIVWDADSHQRIGEPVEGSRFAFSPDDTLLAIGRYKEVVLYDLRSHRPSKRTLAGPAKNISAIVFNPQGTLVAAGSEDTTIGLWDVRSGKPLATLTGHAAAVRSLLFDPGGSTLFSGSEDGTIIRWNLEADAMDTPVDNLGAAISSISLAPDGRVRSLALEKNRVIVVDVNADPPLGRRIKAANAGMSNIAFSPSGRFLASSAEFGDVVEWDVARGELHGEPLSGHDRQVTSLAYSPDGKVLVSGSVDGVVILLDLDRRAALGPPVKAHRSPVWSLACSPNGKTAVSSGDAELILWDLATRKQLGPSVKSQKDRIWTLAFSRDGSYLASAGNERVVDIWKAGHDIQFMKSVGDSGAGPYQELMPAGVSFNPDGTLLAASARDSSVTIWNLKSGRSLLPALSGPTRSVSSVDFTRDGKLLVTGSSDGEIGLWDVQTHELIGTLRAGPKGIRHVAFSPQEELLASVSADDWIVFWQAGFERWRSRACRVANRNLTPGEWGTYFGNRPYRKTCPDL
jgi:WD40 repeat protein